MKKEMYKVEFVWWNACKDIVLCTSYTMALMIVRDLFDNQYLTEFLTDILIYDLEGNYQYLKQNGKATNEKIYKNLIIE